jgi:uncharacterized membrane protein
VHSHDAPASPGSPSVGAHPAASRLLALDALRGLIMVFMALDHASFFVAQQHSSGEYWGGPFPHYAAVLPFLTRLVTHFSAPGFFLLMGAGMALLAHARQADGWSRWRVTRHLLVRGAILIVLQFAVENVAWSLSAGGWGPDWYIGVLFALGGTMVIGSALVWARPGALLVLAVALFVGMELAHPSPGDWAALSGNASIASLLLITPGGQASLGLWSNYPVLPWLELVVFGMALGHWAAREPDRAFRRALWIGAVLLPAFAVIRLLDGFGNIRPRAGDTWIDFLNVVKYPPSMAFTLMTTGVNLVLLGLFARAGGPAQRALRPLAVFGRSPLFFYALHLFLYMGLGWLVAPHGMSIPAMLPWWLLGLAILFPLCWWYGRLKQRQPAASLLRYL